MGPLSLEAGLVCLRAAGSGHPSFFNRGRGQASTVGASHSTGSQSWEKTAWRNTQTHTALHAACVRMHCWVKMMVVWLRKRRVPHHVIALVAALLVSAIPRVLYNWEAADSCDPAFTPHSPSCLPQSRWQKPPTRDSSFWDVPFFMPLFFGKLFTNLSWDQAIKQSSFFFSYFPPKLHWMS